MAIADHFHHTKADRGGHRLPHKRHKPNNRFGGYLGAHFADQRHDQCSADEFADDFTADARDCDDDKTPGRVGAEHLVIAHASEVARVADITVGQDPQPPGGVKTQSVGAVEHVLRGDVGRAALGLLAVNGRVAGDDEEVPVEGARAVTLLQSREPILSPRFAPDGKRIAYVSFEQKRPRIFVQNIDTGRREQITNFEGLNIVKNSSLGVVIGFMELVSSTGGTTLNQTGQALSASTASG